MVVSGNVHNFAIWPVVLGNFVFYAAISYAGWGIRERRKHQGKGR